jgi:hypothetical protein
LAAFAIIGDDLYEGVTTFIGQNIGLIFQANLAAVRPKSDPIDSVLFLG